MRLYNTLTRQLETLQPLNPDDITLYSCGPTVYDFAHIGNLRKFVFDDTLRRTLQIEHAQIRHVMNITDVGHLVADEDESVLSEDKFEKGARREGKSVWDIALRYTESFKADMAALGILPPTVNPQRSQNQAQGDNYARATDFIPEQIDMVKRLLANGFAYQTTQAIYFDITRLDDYGKLTGQNLKDKEVGVRDEVVTDEDKHHPYDFAVWFFTVGHFQDHTMRWPSPWGDGFPGWHLECSAIIHTTLGDPIDIHTGGVDHIGTHHTNEMAQTQGAFHHELSNIWLHSEHLLVDGGKMAKSKGNFFTLADLKEKGFHPLSLRLLYLQAHYRSQQNFTLASLQAAQNTLLNLYAWADQVHQTGSGSSGPAPDWLDRLKAYLLNDLNTPEALAELHRATAGTPPTPEILVELDQLLGLALSGRPDISAAQRRLITERETARSTKAWAEADRLRDQLKEQGIELDDTPAGPHWRRITLA